MVNPVLIAKVIDYVEKADEFVTGDDGYVVFWPHRNSGCLPAYILRIIADELDRRNAEWDEIVQREVGS